MLFIPLLLVPIGFTAGLYLVARFAPGLAPTRTGRVASRVVDILGGAATAVILLDGYLVIRAATADTFNGFDRDTAVASGLAEMLWQGGLLIGAAVAVHLLAPAHANEPDWGSD